MKKKKGIYYVDLVEEYIQLILMIIYIYTILYYTLYRLRENYNINYDIDILSKYFSKEILEQNDLYNKSKIYKIPYVHLKIGGDTNCVGRCNITNWGEDEEIYCK